MKVNSFAKAIKHLDINIITGVPDSTLKVFCDYVNGITEEKFEHYITANEAGAVGLAIGTYLATRRPACIYMQNSGLGNIVNPITSLANEKVYDIPMLLVIGWRGEPGKKDEPQHKFMGEITLNLLEDLNIQYSILSNLTTEEELNIIFQKAIREINNNKQYAMIVTQGTFIENTNNKYIDSKEELSREEVIKTILQYAESDSLIVSTTGKISREVYEQSNNIYGNHDRIFLTVGGMGNASMIASGIAVSVPNKKVYCIDGDGATLMHMGNLAFIGKTMPRNLIHICLNNDAHESVGGMPTAAVGLPYSIIADNCGYTYSNCINSMSELKQSLQVVKLKEGTIFLEVKVKNESRGNLSRPNELAKENKIKFMENFK
ncbi:phosphonopyruvate decarboxylase [Anaerocolumna sp. AGMB13020]|uniref:phosphonopyruvate decarboxylase n=1 Tax=Anaerocolumna sp. AGMB13020 TaxID=3081750 RepID=UPI002954DC57|nr:phosphonopyruvate decarboxylase [Anaerocolumna sp. AGMB13020]WOO35163.1 phosphonopyruvate decarboxylase [Anaerocolumna sp. AGMB13020]